MAPIQLPAQHVEKGGKGEETKKNYRKKRRYG